MHTITQIHFDAPIEIPRLITCARGFLEHATETRIRIVSQPNPDPKVDALTLLRCAGQVLRLRSHVLLVMMHLQHLSVNDREKTKLSECEAELRLAHERLFSLAPLLAQTMAIKPTQLH